MLCLTHLHTQPKPWTLSSISLSHNKTKKPYLLPTKVKIFSHIFISLHRYYLYSFHFIIKKKRIKAFTKLRWGKTQRHHLPLGPTYLSFVICFIFNYFIFSLLFFYIIITLSLLTLSLILDLCFALSLFSLCAYFSLTRLRFHTHIHTIFSLFLSLCFSPSHSLSLVQTRPGLWGNLNLKSKSQSKHS